MPATITLTDEELTSLVRETRDLTFGSRENRDRAAAIAKRLGLHHFDRRSISGQCLDLHYVDDSTDRVDRGLYNERAYWPKLYMLNTNCYAR